MNATTTLKGKAAATSPDRKVTLRRAAPPGPGASAEAKRRAAAILEVLAGLRLPAEAASALGVSLPRFYLLEQQALTGLVQGCEPRPHGRSPTPERELVKLRKELERLQRESARQQALVRATQRTIGLSLPEPARAKPLPGKNRRRRPSVRALKHAARLQSDTQRHDDHAAPAPCAPAAGDGSANLRPAL